jgi:sugar/nucleoside kinase (ribokinase family)
VSAAVIALGNALVDVLSHESEAFLDEHAMVKGSMALIESDRAERLYAAMGPAIEISGGSAANTVVGIASFGGTAAFVGRVFDDQLGEVYAHDLRAAGVAFHGETVRNGAPTGRCLIVVTPDGERTLNTYLGASSDLAADDVDESVVANAQVTYLEGYLWDSPSAQDAFRRAAEIAHANGRKVALTLSDSFVVDRHRGTFLELVSGHIDILLANEAEICSLYEVDEFDAAVARVRDHCWLAALTRSEQGSVLLTSDELLEIEAHPIPGGKLIDTTGAGDLYAAGLLYGITQGHDLETAGRLGSLAAAEIISHIGARPEASLAELAGPILDGASRANR